MSQIRTCSDAHLDGVIRTKEEISSRTGWRCHALTLLHIRLTASSCRCFSRFFLILAGFEPPDCGILAVECPPGHASPRSISVRRASSWRSLALSRTADWSCAATSRESFWPIRRLPGTRSHRRSGVETVAPGAYTAIVRGNNRTTGVGLVEVHHSRSPRCAPADFSLSHLSGQPSRPCLKIFQARTASWACLSYRAILWDTPLIGQGCTLRNKRWPNRTSKVMTQASRPSP